MAAETSGDTSGVSREAAPAFIVTSEDGASYRIRLDDVPFAEVILAPDLRIVAVNKVVREWFPEIDFSQSPPCWRLWSPAPPERGWDGCPSRAAFADGAPHVAERECLTALGIRTLVISAAPVIDDDGRVVAASMTLRDVTEERAARQRTREQEDLVAAIGESMGDALVVLDDRGRIVLWNRAAERLFGYARDEVLGADVHGLLAPRLPEEAVQEQFQRFAAEGTLSFKEGALELAARAKSGEEIPVEVVLSPVRFDGRAHVAAVVRDIRERKAAEAATAELLDAARRNALLIESMTEGVALHEIVLDDAGRPVDYRFLDVNPAFESILGLRKRDIVGKTVREVLPGVEQAWIDRYGEVALTGVAQRFEDHASALGRWFEVTAYSPQPGQFVTVVTDITYRKKAEQSLKRHNAELERRVAERTRDVERPLEELRAANAALEEAVAMRDDFLRAMSHELRTPLNSVLGFSELLLSGLAGDLDDEQKRQVGFIRASGEQLLTLVNDVLDLSLLRAGQAHVDIAEFDAREMLDEALSGLKMQAEDKGLALAWSVQGEPAVRSDKRRIVQILHNLVGNAVKFTESGEVRVLFVHDSDGVELSVSDTGPGIPAEERGLIFEEFYQVARRGAAKPLGAGVGLSVVKGVAELLGGAVVVESEPGRGSTFRVQLPEIESPFESEEDGTELLRS
ncbi:PAS domain S-box protein [Coriobacteriia bacterium Es71-Z0120]|uniref:sensor histidine kinase n=1 Tax=Parvivirga hydrogeniphila TaxID=2939460 RepID=UPI00226094D9|nr:PAS domain S-box protein [Parvivirga hydrogeniphila]MCL4079524.1 PAS domain S-box protein [Parvivirga hydrogeniphila]